MRHGEGKMKVVKLIGTHYYATGDRYEGQFVDDKRHGWGITFIQHIGIYYYNNNNKYEGEWREDKVNGKGKLLIHNRYILLWYWRQV